MEVWCIGSLDLEQGLYNPEYCLGHDMAVWCVGSLPGVGII